MKSFIFYENFKKAIQNLDDKDRLAVYDAITNYGLYGELPEDESSLAYALVQSLVPSLDKTRRWQDSQIENAKKGGRPAKVSYDEIAEVIIETEGKLTAEELANRLNMNKNTLLKSQAWKDRAVILKATVEKSNEDTTVAATKTTTVFDF